MGWIFFIITIVVALSAIFVYRSRTRRAMERLEEAHRDKLRKVVRDSEARVTRIERESKTRRKQAGLDVVADLLPAFDALRQGLHGSEEAAASDLRDGMKMVLDAIETALHEHGIEVVDPDVGDVFAPQMHEAVEVVETEEESGTVAACRRVGYRRDDYVLRPALVAVTRADEPASKATDDGPTQDEKSAPVAASETPATGR